MPQWLVIALIIFIIGLVLGWAAWTVLSYELKKVPHEDELWKPTPLSDEEAANRRKRRGY